MLDQNTDRMWYVIGAVLIGAAIIFGMNTMMPNAFASVSGMFEDMTYAVKDVAYHDRLEEIGYVEPDGVNVLQKDDLSGLALSDLDLSRYNSEGIISFTTGNHEHSGVRMFFEDYSSLEPNMVYTLSYKMKKTDSENDLIRIGGHISSPFMTYSSYLNGVRDNHHLPVDRDDLNNSNMHEVVVHFTTPETLDMDDVRDDRGIWIQPNRSIRNSPISVEVYDLKVQRGIVGTPQ